MSRDLLPTNATAFEKANSETSSRLLDLDVAAIRRERDPARCDAAFVPFLAWERSVHFYDPADDAGNRSRIESSFQDHLNYGSPDALEAEIALDTGQTVRLIEFWQERDLTWPDFVVESVIAPGDPQPDLDAVMASALKRKNVRDMPIARLGLRQPPGLVNVGATQAVSMRIANAVKPPPPPPYVGAAQRLTLQTQVRPL